MTKEFTQPHLDDSYTHIDHEAANPFARIECRVRTALPTLCDGTCRNCKQERISFLEGEVERRRNLINANPEFWSSPEMENPPNKDDIANILQEQIAVLTQEKVEIVVQKLELIQKATERMRILRLQASSPEPPTSVN